MSEASNLIDDSSLSGPANSRYHFLRDLNLDLDVVRRLALHLDRLSEGDTDILTSAIGKDNDPNYVLELWDETFNSNIGKMNEVLLNLELSNRSKFGPRSISKPWKERIPDVEKYYSDMNYRLPYDVLSGMKTYNRGKLRPCRLEAALSLLKSNTNSGLPYYTKKGRIKDRLIQKFEYLLDRRDPCILFTRTQEANKTRNVWGYPSVDTLEEMRYYKPILTHQSRLSWRSALKGPDEVSRCVSKLIYECIDTDKVILSGDISAFDANVVNELSKAAFYYMKQLFQSDYRVGLDRICDRFLSIGLLTPDGVVEGSHGVPSGSTFTNEVDSIVQYLIVKSLNFSDQFIQIQGDDLLLGVNPNELDEVYKRFEDSHLPINIDKSSVAKDYCMYLQCLYHIDYAKRGYIGGIYPTYRALNRILFQERWSDFEDYDLNGIDYYSIRTISILENCKWHPLFEDLVKFVYKLDKYSLRFSQKAINKYDTMLNNSSGTGGFLYNQYSDNVRGINSFETVKIIKSLNKH